MEFDENIKLTEEEFNYNTINTSLFTINDVNGDNACMYRSLANYIYYATPHDDLLSLKRFKNWGEIKNIDIVSTKFGYYSEEQDELARFIQKLILHHIKINADTLIEPINMKIRDCVPLFHDMEYNEYISVYTLFAGEHKDNVSDKNKDKLLYDRWGSILELTVFSNIVCTSVIIFNSQIYNKRTKKINTGKIINSKPQKDVRLKIFQIINKKYLYDKLPIFLIWKKHHNYGHFMVCYPNNHNTILEELSNYL